MFEHVRSVIDIIRGSMKDRQREERHWVVGLSRQERSRSQSAPYLAAQNYAAGSLSSRRRVYEGGELHPNVQGEGGAEETSQNQM
jgi:hypothetical protein